MHNKNTTNIDIPIDYIPSNIVIYRYSDDDFIFIDFNKYAEKTENISREEVIGKYITEVFPGVKKFGLFDVLLHVYKNGGNKEQDICFYEDERINGWRHNRVSKLPNGDLIVSYTDMTKEKQLEVENLKQKNQFEEAQKIAHLGSWEWDIKSNEIVWSDEVFRIFGEEPQSFIPTYDRFLSYLPKEGKDALKEAVQNAIDNKETYMFKHEVQRKDGVVYYVQESGNARFDDQGEAISMIGTVLDITKHVQLEEKLKLHKLAVEQSTSSIFITDRNGLIEYANPHFYKVSGYTSNDIIGKSPKMFKSGNQYYSFYKELWNTITSGKDWHGEMVNVYKDGRKRHELTSVSPIKDEEGNIKHFVAVKEDIREIKDLQDKLIQKAHYDPLTNIPNRTLFFDRSKQILAISKRKKQAFALMFIDLDGFKSINDTYGHDIGDHLLIEVSKKLESCIREIDTVARMGGDEFVIVLADIASHDEPGIVAERIIDMIMEPFQISGHICHIGASIGISLYPEHSSDLDELLALADKAMYEVKSSGKNNYRYVK